ncbi:MAG: amidohydrolase family protein [Alphaproteobacteria bacterium]|nr:amidohydrolase family protein [Alphaproteobacteria bacterium]
MLYRCTPHIPQAPRSPADDRGHAMMVTDGAKTTTVDIHCHASSAAVAEKMQAERDRTGNPPLAGGNELTAQVNKDQFAAIEVKMSSVDERLADMDAAGVDIQAVSVPPYQYFYWADPDLGREVSAELNDYLAGIVASHPDRFVGLGTVPLQNTELAIAELERCVGELGFKGIELSTHCNDEQISAPRLEKFYQRVEELGTLIFIHPDHFTDPERLAEHYFINLIGNPLESTIAVGHLIFDGVLERYPGLKICIAHGGGFMPAYHGRFDHGQAARPDSGPGLPHNPSHYLKKLYFDTLVFDPGQLGYLIDTYGPDHVLLGTDYPYDMGEADPNGLVDRVAGLSDDAAAMIKGGNAARLLGLDLG